MFQWLCNILCPPPPTLEKPSPKIRVTPSQLHINTDGELWVTGLKGCYLAALEPSNSMEPGIDDGMYVVLDPTIPYTDLIVGDIIYYDAASYRAIHRIITISNDGTGWFAITKGDNNSADDGIKVREWFIKGVWRATIN